MSTPDEPRRQHEEIRLVPCRYHEGEQQLSLRDPYGNGTTLVCFAPADLAALREALGLGPGHVVAVVEQLITSPERYVAAAGGYPDGYLDALIDVLSRLGLAEPPPNYEALREGLMADGRRVAMRELYRQVMARAQESQPPFDVAAGLARLQAWMEQDLAAADGTITGPERSCSQCAPGYGHNNPTYGGPPDLHDGPWVNW